MRHETTDKKGSMAKKIFLILGIVILFLLVIGLLAGTLISKNRETPLQVLGYSLVCIDEASETDYAENGTAVLFSRQSDPALAAGDRVVIRGSNPDESGVQIYVGEVTFVDETLETDNIQVNGLDYAQREVLGTVTAALPVFGFVFMFLQTPLGLILCVALPLLALLIFEIFHLVRRSRKAKAIADETQADDAEESPVGKLYEPAGILGRDPQTSPISSLADLVDMDLPLPGKEPAVLMDTMESPYVSDLQATREIPIPQVPPIEETQEFTVEHEALESPVTTPVFPSNEQVPPPYAEGNTKFAEDANGYFVKSLSPYEPDRFKLYGADVKIENGRVFLALGQSGQKVMITMGEDYTGITVDGQQTELNFAFVQDKQKNQKFLIRKQNKLQ